MSSLMHDDICGSLIKTVLESVQIDYCDGYSSRRAFVELNSGKLFELLAQDPSDVLPIVDLSANPPPMSQVEIAGGQTVVQVVRSDFWPTLGLLLDGKSFLFCSDILVPGHVRPVMVDVGGRYGLRDVSDYWTGRPLG